MRPRHDDENDVQGGLPKSIRERLYKARTILISSAIDQKIAARVTAELLAMAAESDEPITIYLNSQGGHVESGDTIHDMIQFIAPEVRIVGTGWVASAGAFIFVSVPLERRFCLPNTRFLLHQPAGGARGTASDVEIEANEILKMRERLNRIFAERTGQSLEKIKEDTHRNFWLDADAAKEYGLVGSIVKHIAEVR